MFLFSKHIKTDLKPIPAAPCGWVVSDARWFLYPSFLSFGEGFTLPPTPFPDPGTSLSRRLRASYCAFFAILVPFFFSSLFRCLFGSIFGRFFGPTWPPKSTKIGKKSMPRGTAFSTPFFDRFLINFWSQLRSPKTKKSLKFHLFYCIFCKMGLPKLRSIFGAFLVPTWLQFASQNPPKTSKNPPQETSKN